MRHQPALMTTQAEIGFYCRSCKGHYTKVLPLDVVKQATCRCGSTDLLIYQLEAESAAPLRGA